MTEITTAFWEMTINNYDEKDLALVQQGYPDHIRQLVYTLEKGESGTPHIQAYIRLYRQQRMSYVRKLFPGARFQPLVSESYKLNAQRYAQKLDKTAESPAVITNNPFPDPVAEAISVIRDVLETFAESNDVSEWRKWTAVQVFRHKRAIENIRVEERPSLAKFYVSAVYSKVWDLFAGALLNHVCSQREREISADTHTHTHSREKFSHAEGITDAHPSQDEDGEEGEDDEGDDSCSSSGTETSGESDDDEYCESDSQSQD